MSLLGPWALAFDPQAWLVWGREVTRLSLDTRPGPSWKPLPVLLTTPFALTGAAAPVLWIVVARAGALLALAGAARVAARVGGRGAGAAAALAMVLSPWWSFNAALGNSEGLLAAAVLWAVAAHLDGRGRLAVALGAAAALLRPEVWPFLAAYGAWLWGREPSARRAVAAAAVVVPLLWFGPDAIGAGGALGASSAARGEASVGSAGLAAVPALAVARDAVTILSVPAFVLAALAVLTVEGQLRWLAAGAVAWVAIVAAMAQAGYAGNPRYLVAAAAVGCAVAGAGAARLAAASRAPVLLAPVVVGLAVGAVTLGQLGDRAAELGVRADRRRALDRLVADAGGRARIVRCARVRTAEALRAQIAWTLDLPMAELDEPPLKPAVVLRTRPYDGGPVQPPMQPARRGFELRARAPGWEAWEACGSAPQTAG